MYVGVEKDEGIYGEKEDEVGGGVGGGGLVGEKD